MMVTGLVLMSCSGSCVAQTLEESVRDAAGHDAQYMAQKAAVGSRRFQAKQAGTAYWPYASAAYTQRDTSATAQGRTSTSLVLTQPLLSYDRYLTLQQADTLENMAQAEERQAGEALVLRVFSAMAEIVRNREALRVSASQISGVSEQLKRARRMKELGQGTITEISDFEVMLAMARAGQVRLQSQLDAAVRTYTQLTGRRPVVQDIQIELPLPDLKNDLLDQLREKAKVGATDVVLARSQLEQAQLAAKRQTAQYFPQLVAQAYRYSYTDAIPVTVSGFSLSVSIPLSGTSYYENRKSATEVNRSEENLRYVQDVVNAQLDQLVSDAIAQVDEIQARENAVAAAKLSVEANTKSYMGGVKSNLDILNSYQNLVQAETSLIDAKLRQMEIALRLNIKTERDHLVPIVRNVEVNDVP